MNTLFDNPEEDIILNNEEIDEDELKENNIDENNLMTEQYDDTNNDKEVQLNHETQEGNESNRRMRQPNTKYKDFYQFLIKQQNQKKIK